MQQLLAKFPHWTAPSRLSLLGVTACATMLSSGCPAPDVDAKVDRFEEDTKDVRIMETDGPDDTGGDGALSDISGEHLFALSATLMPSTPLQFIATVDLQLDEDGTGGTMDIDFQPLSLDVGSTTAPREFVGDVIEVNDIPVDETGSFTADLGTLTVTGAANPITGSDITATLVLQGNIRSEDFWCGSVTGNVSSPIDLDLQGSTFAAVRVPGTDPASLPAAVIFTCADAPEGGAEEGGTGDGGSETTGE